MQASPAPASAPASLRKQLAALVIVTVLPFAALHVWTLYAGLRDDEQRARDQVYRLALLTASHTARFLSQANNIVNGLAARPAVQALDPARCDPILKDLLGLAPRFANVATMTLDGGVVCSAASMKPGARMDRAKFLDRLRPPGELTIGELTPGTLTGRWAIPVGTALRGEGGRIAGAVGLAIDLVSFPVMPGVEGLPKSAVVGILSGDGTVLAHSGDPSRFVGTNNRDRPQTRRLLAERQGTSEDVGLDGVVRIRGYAPVPGTDWIAVASLPASEVYAGARGRIAASALLALGLAGAALVLAAGMSWRIAAPISDLAATAREVAAGNLAARARAAGTAETAAVAGQFNRMLEAREQAETALRESEARLRRILDNMFPFIGLLSSEGRVLEVNRAPLEAAGLERDEVIGRDCAGLLWFSYSAEVQARLRAALARAAAGEVARYDEKIRVRGGLIDIDLMLSPLRDASGRIGAIVGSATDITQRKAAEADRLALSRRILETAETERRAVSRELHDRIGQNLATLSLNLKLLRSRIEPHAPAEALARIADAQSLLEATARQARDLMAELDPPALEDFGLLAALRVHAQSFGERVGMRITVAGAECEPRLAPRIEMALFRVAQEALANAAKHSRAGRVEVVLACSPARVTLAVADDGAGFDASQPQGGSWGLGIMRERAAAVGGELRVESTPGRGTRVSLELARVPA